MVVLYASILNTQLLYVYTCTDIPGYHYDAERRRYFRIPPSHFSQLPLYESIPTNSPPIASPPAPLPVHPPLSIHHILERRQSVLNQDDFSRYEWSSCVSWKLRLWEMPMANVYIPSGNIKALCMCFLVATPIWPVVLLEDGKLCTTDVGLFWAHDDYIIISIVIIVPVMHDYINRMTHNLTQSKIWWYFFLQVHTIIHWM